MKVDYDSRCGNCDGRIAKNKDDVKTVDGELVHSSCEDFVIFDDDLTGLCTDCYLVHRGECM